MFFINISFRIKERRKFQIAKGEINGQGKEFVYAKKKCVQRKRVKCVRKGASETRLQIVFGK